MTLSENNDLTQPLSRLRWACRRGMLELDVLLGNFLTEAYATLSDEKKTDFVEFLTHSDPDIMAWIMNRETPPTPALAHIAAAIHAHAKQRL